jgi:hypothetical protein
MPSRRNSYKVKLVCDRVCMAALRLQSGAGLRIHGKEEGFMIPSQSAFDLEEML